MAKTGKYERVDPDKKKKSSSKQRNKAGSNNKHNDSKKKQSQQQRQKPRPKVEPTVENIVVQDGVNVETVMPSINDASSRNPMNATRVTIASTMPELDTGEKKASPIDQATGKLIYHDANELAFADKIKNLTETNAIDAEQFDALTQSGETKQRPYEKRRKELDLKKQYSKPAKTKQTQSKQHAPSKPKKKKTARIEEEEDMYSSQENYNAYLKQVEKEGTIAGLILLLVMGLLFGTYYLLSQAFPAISVDNLSNKLIEWVFGFFIKITSEPIDLESIPIFGDILQWIGTKWEAMVF